MTQLTRQVLDLILAFLSELAADLLRAAYADRLGLPALNKRVEELERAVGA